MKTIFGYQWACVQSGVGANLSCTFNCMQFRIIHDVLACHAVWLWQSRSLHSFWFLTSLSYRLNCLVDNSSLLWANCSLLDSDCWLNAIEVSKSHHTMRVRNIALNLKNTDLRYCHVMPACRFCLLTTQLFSRIQNYRLHTHAHTSKWWLPYASVASPNDIIMSNNKCIQYWGQAWADYFVTISYICSSASGISTLNLYGSTPTNNVQAL